MKRLVLLSLPAVLAGCATTAEVNDPSQGGFGNALSGVLGGQYDERITTRRADLDAERRRQLELNAMLAPLLAERDELAVAVRQAETRISAQRVRIAELRRSISTSQRATAAQTHRLGELDQELARAEQRAASLDAYSTVSASTEIQDDISMLEADLDRLNAEFEDLAAAIG